MNKRLSLFLKIFLPLLVIVAAVHLCIFYAMGRRPGRKVEKDVPPVANADLDSLPPPAAVEPQMMPSTQDITPPAAAGPLPKYDFSRPLRLPPAVQRLSVPGKGGIIVDLSSRRVLWSKNAKKPLPVASLTKLMTALLLMEDISSGRIKFTTPLPVTSAATSVERSCVLGMQRGERYIIEELVAAMMINSHNDAAAQLAAAVSGTVPDFIRKMNTRAGELGLYSAKFNSPNGLPQGKARQNSVCSVNDITRLCEKLMAYPELIKYCRMKSKKLHTGKVVYSHNHLLGIRRRSPEVPGIFGFKTGYTGRAGFCLAFGVKRQNRVIIGCVAGFPSAKDRDNFCRALIEWAYSIKR